MRIREIEAENFKLFTKNFHEVNEIEKSDLIVFNGPNGYGKTNSNDNLHILVYAPKNISNHLSLLLNSYMLFHLFEAS